MKTRKPKEFTAAENRSAFLFAQASRLLDTFGYGAGKDPVGRVQLLAFDDAELAQVWEKVKARAPRTK